MWHWKEQRHFVYSIMIIFRHILRAHAAPFIGSFLILMFLFVLQFMMKFMDQLAGKGLSGAVILELMALNLAWIVVLAVPMAVLVATLMAFGGLSSNSEITAMKETGAGVLTYLMVQFDNKVLQFFCISSMPLGQPKSLRSESKRSAYVVFSSNLPG